MPRCDIAVRHASNFTSEEFERDFVALRRPVAIVGGALAADAKAHTAWRRERFAKRYGHMDIAVAEIPYAAEFGRGKAQQNERSTIGQYCEFQYTCHILSIFLLKMQKEWRISPLKR